MSQLPVSSTGAGALAVALDAALRAGDIVKDCFHSQKEVRFKGPSDPVTNVDLAAEKAATDFLAKEYPAFGFVCEESEPINPDAEYRWIIDPIDGTRNYVMGIPHVGVSIGLADRSGIAAGVVYDPIRGEIFTAERGAGAHLNGEPISVSAKTGLDGCLLGFDIGATDRDGLTALEIVSRIWPQVQSVRLMGCSTLALAYAACGRLDLYFHRRLSQWDLAAGHLLVSEAGGVLRDRYGNPTTYEGPSVIAASPPIMDAFLQATEGLAWRK